MSVVPFALQGFEFEPFTSSSRRTHDVYRRGRGPAVIIIHEIPGITPLLADFARKVADRGMTAVLPSLLGTAGRPMTVPYALSSLARACVSKEFTLLALNKTSPIVDYLRELAVHEREAHGGPGVGAVGMCLTGGFALAMCVEPSVIAPVLSQPSLPFPTNPDHRRALGLSDTDFGIVQRRTTQDLCVMGLRFSGDTKSPAERFVRLRETLGDKFIGVEIDSSPSNPWGYRKGAHSVLTEDYSDEPTGPTRRALEGVLDFLTSRLDVKPIAPES
ncbi:MAG: dienelactone hydrolase family protein [Acidimicrobiales bacterium]|jgi:dienelactone hydrolase